ncbi:MAG: hypothetical protein ACREM8_02585 [Vulcanimicrobiaceae bacterium]
MQKKALWLAALVFAGGVLWGPIPLHAQEKPLFSVVPFGEPGDTDIELDFATKKLAQLLSDAHIRSSMIPPLDPFEAMGDAANICKEEHASGLIIGTLVHNENRDRLSISMIPGLGVADATGALDTWHVKAQLRLRVISCAGKVTWSTITISEATHHGTNLPSAISMVISEALKTAVTQFAFHIGTGV